MKYLVMLVALILSTSATTAMASGPYVGASGGPTFYHDSDFSTINYGTYNTSYDPGFAFNLSGGYKFDNGVRLEGEFGYKRAEQSSNGLTVTTQSYNSYNSTTYTVFSGGGNLTVKSFMLNGYYDFGTNLPVTPFVGAGVGALLGTFSDGGDTSDVVAGYQLSAGASYKINDRLNLDLSYRFEGAVSDFNLFPYSISYDSSNLLLGVRYSF